MVFSFFCHPPTQCFFSIFHQPPLRRPGLLASFPFWPLATCSTVQPGSPLVHRWVFFKTQSTFPRLSNAYTCHFTVITSYSTPYRHLAICRQHCRRWSVSSTCRRVISTPQTIGSFGPFSTFITPVIAGCWVVLYFRLFLFFPFFFLCFHVFHIVLFGFYGF
jgi:hypothetical protein